MFSFCKLNILRFDQQRFFGIKAKSFDIIYFGKIDFLKFNSNIDTTPNNNAKCPKTIEEMGKTCCKAPEGQTSEIQAVVSMVYVSASCECPTPTQYYDMAPEGGGTLYKLCDCKCS